MDWGTFQISWTFLISSAHLQIKFSTGADHTPKCGVRLITIIRHFFLFFPIITKNEDSFFNQKNGLREERKKLSRFLEKDIH